MSEHIQYTIKNKAELKKFMDLKDEALTSLCITAWVVTDLSVLKNYPNLRKLCLYGKFSGFEYVAGLEFLDTLVINLVAFEYADLEKLMSTGLRHLEVKDMRKLDDLSFVEKAVNLERLYLYNLPGIKTFPSFHKVYSLKSYELHKLENLEALQDSEIRYLDLTLCADKLSATKIADNLLEMKRLEKVCFYFIDRNCRRTDAIQRRLIKYGKESLIAETEMFHYDNWKTL